jgi:signal transduction histidine kinase
MPRALGRLRRLDPVIFVIVALLCASAAVIFLQHRALRALDRQTSYILQKVAEQHATATSLEIRRTFDGPVSTLGAVNHPLLVAGRMDLVASEFAEGLQDYSQVERFFGWNAVTDAAAPGEALFYGRRGDGTPLGPRSDPSLASFQRDPPLGRLLLARARQYAGSQRIYAAFSERVGGTPYDIFVRVFYTDAARTGFFAILGFVVNLDTVRTQLFPALYRTRFAAHLEPPDGSPPFELRVHDESGRLVFGSAAAAATDVSARSAFALQFYPVGLAARMGATVEPREWTLTISPRSNGAPGGIVSTRLQGYWLSALSVLLMFVALAFAVSSRRRAAQLAAMQSEFVTHVSHQLKTPLSLLSAVGETMALDRVRSTEKLAQCVDIVRTETARLSALVERILEFSRADEGRRAYEMEVVNLAALASETTEAFARALASEGYQIDVVTSGAPPVVIADPAALEQALVNLLDNAVKYSKDHKTVTVRVGAAGPDAVIEVEDRGIGMAVADRARIFERFYRGAGAVLHRHGFGLGLAIAAELVAAHRGRIEVETEPGLGSTFRIRIPLLHRAGAEPASRWREGEVR